MDLDGNYKLFGFELEPNVREVYNKGIKTLRESDDPSEHFKAFGEIFKVLGESHSSPNKGIEWAKELISAYRNMGRIFKKISSEYEYIPKSLLDELSHFKKSEFKGDNYLETIVNIFEELDDIYNTLNAYHIVSSDLEERLEKAEEADDLREKIRVLENL